MPFNSYISLITPFDVNNKIDARALKRLAQELTKSDVAGFFLASEIGEGDLLSFEEKFELAYILSETVPSNIPLYLHLKRKDVFNAEFSGSLSLLNNLGIVISLQEYQGLAEEVVLDQLIELSNYKKPLILDHVSAASKELLNQILALPYIFAVYQKNLDIQLRVPQGIKKFTQLEKKTTFQSLETYQDIVSYYSHIDPSWMGEFKTNHDLELSKQSLKKQKNLLFLLHELSTQDATALIKAFLAKEGKCLDKTRKKLEDEAKTQQAELLKKLDLIKND